MSENINLADKSQLALWQSYCDKKMECESLTEEVERLRYERDMAISMLKVVKDDIDDYGKLMRNRPERINRLLSEIFGVK